MGYWVTCKRVCAPIGALTIMGALASTTALAAGPGLPRTYQVQRVDSPAPEPSGLFSLGMNAVGDLNKDGKVDLLVPQVPGFNQDGQVFVFSGATGQLIDTIPAPDAGGSGGKAQFGLLGIWYAGDARNASPFSDLGSCPGGSSGKTCPLPAVGPPDGVPDLLVGATGVDVGGAIDAGRNYVLDGATRAVLKRIDVPPADRQAGQGFGREPLTPAGMPGCAGNFGVGPCPPTSGVDAVPETVRIGDMDGGGKPDLVLSARRYTESSTTAAPGSQCAKTTGVTCASAGRVYVYRGEDVAGSNPAEILDGVGTGETVRTLKNPEAQADDPESGANPESFGNDLIPVGDLGTCRVTTPAGDRCPAVSTTTTPDGIPDFVASSPGVDLPAANPDPSLVGVGVAFLVDGATGSILFEYQHPDPQRGAGFGGNFEQTLAVGDLGDSGQPDIWLAAPNQNGRYVAQGRGYVMNGSFKTASLLNFAGIFDPTPAVTEKNFGSSLVGVGDLVGGPDTPANEVLVGASGPNLVQNVRQETVTDIHFFNPATEKTLQSIANPDGAIESAFGDSIEPLGDLNGDGFFDFAAGAFRFSGTTGVAQGRFYIFRSDNSPTPATPPGAASPPAGTPPPPAPGLPAATPPSAAPGTAPQPSTRSGRSITLLAKGRVTARKSLALTGVIRAVSDRAGCEVGQAVAIQRRTTGGGNYKTVLTVRSRAGGAFTAKIKPTRSYVYRVQVGETARCLRSVSNSKTVKVVRARR